MRKKSCPNRWCTVQAQWWVSVGVCLCSQRLRHNWFLAAFCRALQTFFSLGNMCKMSLHPSSTWPAPQYFLLTTMALKRLWQRTEIRPLSDWREFSVDVLSTSILHIFAQLRSCSFHQLGKYLSSFCPFSPVSPYKCHSSHLNNLSTFHQPMLCPPSKFSGRVSALKTCYANPA